MTTKTISIQAVNSETNLKQEIILAILEDEMVNLTQIWKESGGDKNKIPAEWLRQSETIEFIENLKYGQKPYLKSKRGNNGGTIAHWQIALEYLKYLHPKLKIVSNNIFKERLEETLNPELGISRAIERAQKRYNKLGKSKKWQERRITGIQKRHLFTDACAEHNVCYAQATNTEYRTLFGKNAKGLRDDMGLPAKASIRDNMTQMQLLALDITETHASEKMDTYKVNGTINGCKVIETVAHVVNDMMDNMKKLSFTFT